MNKYSLLRKPLGFEGKFTQFPNAWARDDRIGFRAKGLLILLMSHSEGWRISLQHLAGASPDGITAIRTAVQELEDAGYLNRTLVRNEKSQVEGSEWILSDPFENLMSENLMSGNLTLKNTIDKNTSNKENNKKELNNKSVDYHFEIFWKHYPRKIGKGAARKAFEKALEKKHATELIESAYDYANSSSLPDLQFIPHPATWLNQERWDDELNASGGSNATQVASDILKRGKALQNRIEGMSEIES